MTTKVVQKGMTWSQDAANKAAQAHKYIKIGPKAGFLLLSGAPGRWKKPEFAADVYVPSLRVAGNPQMIRQVFIGLGVPAGDIDRHLAASYSLNNYREAMAANFNAEVAAYKAHKDTRRATTAGPVVQLDKLQYFVDNLAGANVAAKTTTGSPRASPRAGRVKPLRDRIAQAKLKNKVLDVSKMDPVKGTGIKMIPLPGAASKKVGVNLAQVPIVSSDAGNYARAIALLGPGYEAYVTQYNALTRAAPALGAPPVTLPAATSPATMVPLPATTSPAIPTLPGTGVVGGVALPQVGTLPTVTSPAGSPM